MKRGKCYLPHQNLYTSHRPEPYTSQLFYIGANVHFNGFEFHLTDADEFTLNYMESHQSQYPVANISSILSKIKEAIKPIYKDFIGQYLGVASISETGSNPNAINICNETTALALRDLLGNRITEHEIVTFLRYFSADKPHKKNQSRNRSTVQSLIQMAFATHLWDDIQSLKEFIYDIDPVNHNGYMTPAKMRTIIKGCRIPIKDIFLDDMFAV